MTDPEMKAFLTRIKNNLRVTKVVATRSVKGRNGDSFAGFGAAWDSVQEDGGQGLLSVSTETEVAGSGMTLKEAKVAHYLVAMQADIGAHEAALAGGNISPSFCKDAVASIRQNYAKIIRAELGSSSSNTGTSTQ